MCCLKYEQDAYEDLIHTTPKVDAKVRTPDGVGTIIEVNLLRGLCKVKIDDSSETPKFYKKDELEVLGGCGKRCSSCGHGDTPAAVAEPDELVDGEAWEALMREETPEPPKPVPVKEEFTSPTLDEEPEEIAVPAAKQDRPERTKSAEEPRQFRERRANGETARSPRERKPQSDKPRGERPERTHGEKTENGAQPVKGSGGKPAEKQERAPRTERPARQDRRPHPKSADGNRTAEESKPAADKSERNETQKNETQKNETQKSGDGKRYNRSRGHRHHGPRGNRPPQDGGAKSDAPKQGE